MANNTDKWKYEKVSIDLIDDAELNANVMTENDFDTLTNNIRKSGLSSVPTCYKRTDNGRFVLISGHHRIKSCKKLGYSEVGILYADECDLDKDEIIAIQLSHNSLHGEDDRNILKKLFDEIRSIDFKEFAHVNIDEIGSIKTDSAAFSPVMEDYTMSVVLYKNDMDRVQEILGVVRENVAKSDLVVIADGEPAEDVMLSLMKSVKKEFDIRSSSVSLMKIFELASMKMKELKNG